MMKQLSLSVLAAIGLASTGAFAQTHEIGGAATGAFSFHQHDDINFVSFRINAEYGYSLTRNIQLVIAPGFSWANHDDNFGFGVTRVEVQFGPMFNFGGDKLANDLFAGVLGGMTFSHYDLSLYGSDDTYNDVSWSVVARFGKRFALSDTWTYKPYIEAGCNFSPTGFRMAAYPLSLTAVF